VSAKASLILLPSSLDPSLTNRQWLDCAAYRQRQGQGTSLLLAPAGGLQHDYARCAISHTILPAPHNWVTKWQRQRLINDALRSAAPDAQIWLQSLADNALLRRAPASMRRRCFIHDPLPPNKITQKQLTDFLTQGGEVVVNSDFVRLQILRDYGLEAECVTLLPPAVDAAFFDPSQIKPDRALRLAAAWRVPENAALFLHYGAWRPDGGQISMLHALAQTGRRDFYAVLLGHEAAEGYHDRLLEVVNHYGLAGNVLFTEHCPDLPAALWLAQAVVCASRTPTGADPLLLAAQAMGRPLVVSDIGAHLELVSPGHSAWLYPASNTDALNNVLTEILNLGDKARHIHGQQVRQWVMQHFPYTPWRMAMLGEADRTLDSQQAA